MVYKVKWKISYPAYNINVSLLVTMTYNTILINRCIINMTVKSSTKLDKKSFSIEFIKYTLIFPKVLRLG